MGLEFLSKEEEITVSLTNEAKTRSNPKRESLPAIMHADILILDSQSPKFGEDKLIFFKPSGL